MCHICIYKLFDHSITWNTESDTFDRFDYIPHFGWLTGQVCPLILTKKQAVKSKRRCEHTVSTVNLDIGFGCK